MEVQLVRENSTIIKWGVAPPQNPPAKKVTFNKNVGVVSQQEIDQMLNNLLSGGSTRKRKLYNY